MALLLNGITDICKVKGYVKYEWVYTQLGGHEVVLHPLCGLFVPLTKCLVIADVHIGKAAHFRKNGIPIPVMANKNNHWNLVEIVQDFQPEIILFLGDLMHSTDNVEWAEFSDVLAQFPHTRKVLVRGNHELYANEFYERAGLEVVDSFEIGSLFFTHEPSEKNGTYNVSGHLHPAVRLSGKVGQSVKLSCFFLGEKNAILPAFGEFTGNAIIRPQKGDRIYVIAENKVLEIAARK